MAYGCEAPAGCASNRCSQCWFMPRSGSLPEAVFLGAGALVPFRPHMSPACEGGANRRRGHGLCGAVERATHRLQQTHPRHTGLGRATKASCWRSPSLLLPRAVCPQGAPRNQGRRHHHHSHLPGRLCVQVLRGIRSGSTPGRCAVRRGEGLGIWHVVLQSRWCGHTIQGWVAPWHIASYQRRARALVAHNYFRRAVGPIHYTATATRTCTLAYIL